MYNILIDGLKLYREVSCKVCKKVEYSRGGHYFAAAMGNCISVYNTFQHHSGFTFDLVHSFTGHISPINALSWATDSVLFTAGQDGNIYGWTLIHRARIDNFNVLRSSGACKLLATTFTDKRFEAAVCTSDGALHKLIWNGKAAEDCQSLLINKPNENVAISCLSFSLDNQMLFAGTNEGKIRIYDWYSAGKASNCKREIALHNSNPSSDEILHSVKCITMSKNSSIVSTGGNDGSLFVSSMKCAKQESSNEKRTISIFSSQNEDIALINVEEYEESHVLISDLEQKIKTLKKSK